jgi:hypothetical protein
MNLSRFIFLGCLFSFPVFAELAPHRMNVLVDQTSRPNFGSARSEDEMFDYQIRLKLKLVNLTEAAPDIRIDWTMIYDDIASTGRIKRLNLTERTQIGLGKSEEKMFETKSLRLTGKVNKSGDVLGMKYIGYGVRVFEKEKLVFESFYPESISKEVLEIFAAPPSKEHSITKASTKKEEAKPSVASVEPKEVASLPNLSEPKPVVEEQAEKLETAKTEPNQTKLADGGVELFHYSFSPAEIKRALEVVNQMSEEDLIHKVGLMKTAAHNLVLQRPFKSISELPNVSYVKKQAIGSLKDYLVNGAKKK